MWEEKIGQTGWTWFSCIRGKNANLVRNPSASLFYPSQRSQVWSKFCNRLLFFFENIWMKGSLTAKGLNFIDIPIHYWRLPLLPCCIVPLHSVVKRELTRHYNKNRLLHVKSKHANVKSSSSARFGPPACESLGKEEKCGRVSEEEELH